MSVAPSHREVIGSDDECDPKYMPLGTVTLARATHTTRSTPTKVAPGVVSASQSEEERILDGTPYGSTTHSKDASDFEEVSGSEEVSGMRRLLLQLLYPVHVF